MGKPITVLAFLAAMSTAGSAEAANQYYAVMVNDDQAALIDLGTKIRRGDNVTFDLIILQRKPGQAAGQATYWVDGMQEVDCVQHRTRVMLMAALPLDRSRSISSPNAAFRPWTGNAPGGDARAVEDFACRGTANPGIRPVASLATFQKQYFSGEAALADRGDRAIAEAHRALDEALGRAPATPKPAAAAGNQPPRYVVAHYDKEQARIIDRGSIRRTGNIVSVTSTSLKAKPDRVQDVDVYWVEATYEFDCAQHRYRSKISAAHSLDRTQHVGVPINTIFDAWDATDPESNVGSVEALVCRGVMDSDMSATDDLMAIQRSYAAYARSSAAKFAVGGGAPPATVAARPSPPAPRAPVSKPDEASGMDLLVVEQTAQNATIVNRNSLKRQGAIASIDAIMLPREPKTLGDLKLYWIETETQIDCGAHRIRVKVTMFHTLDMSHQEHVPSASYDPWQPTDASMASFEAFMCRGEMAPSFKPISDLQDFRRGFFATPVRAAATPPARPSAPAAAKPVYLMAAVSKDGMTLINKGSMKRQGDIVTFSELDIFPGPARVGDKVVHWAESTEQVDCKSHRIRMRADAYLSENRSTRTPDPKAQYSGWDANAPKSYGRALEEFVCQGKHASDFDPIDDDLDTVRKGFLDAIKAGVFKD